LKNTILSIVSHRIFSIFILLAIIANFLILSLDRYPIKPSETVVLDYANIILIFIFFFEMIMKIIGLTPRGYIIDKFNIFDCLIVIISLVEFSLNIASKTG
jgi:hypothetical protein